MRAVKAVSGVRQALLSAVWLSAAGYLTFVMNFGLNLVLARLLFPKDFGQFALAGSLAEILSIVTGFSFSQGIIQMQDAPGVVETAYVLSLRLYALLLLGGGTLAAIVSRHYPGIFVPLFCGLFAVRNLSVIAYVYSAQLERAFRYNPLSKIRLTSTMLSIAVALVLAKLGAGVWSLLGREAVLAVVALVGARMATGWRYRGGYNPETARRLWAFGRQMFVARALEVMWYRGDTALLGVLAGTLSLGFYDRARYLAEFGQYAVSFAAVQVAFPVYAKLQGRERALTYAYRLSHGLLIRLLLPLLIWLALFPQALVGLLYGAGVRWAETAQILPWLALFGFLLPVLENIKVLLIGIGRLRDAVVIRAVQVIVTLTLLVPAIRLWGPRGAAAVMMLSEVAGLAVGYRALRPQVVSLYLGGYIRPALAAAASGAIVVAAQALHLIPRSGRPAFAVSLAAVGVLYAFCLILIDRRQTQELVGALIAGFRGDGRLGWGEARLPAAPGGVPVAAAIDAAGNGWPRAPLPAAVDERP